MVKHRILVTGSAGSIGTTVVPALLAAGHYVRGFDLKESPGLDDYQIGSLTDMSAIDRAMESMDTLLHFGAEADDCDFMTRLLPANIVGVYNVMDAARRFKLRRVILSSSMQVVNGLIGGEKPIKLEYGTAPTNHYGVTKVFAEAIGKMYSIKFDLSVIAVRIAWFTRNLKELKRMDSHPFAKNFFFSHDDACRFFLKAVEADNITYCILNAASKRHDIQVFDMEAAKELIGYEPQDTFPEGLPFSLD